MNTGDILTRDTDGKRFKVIDLGHWSTVGANDGEATHVKWAGGNKYVAPKGPTFTLEETSKP